MRDVFIVVVKVLVVVTRVAPSEAAEAYRKQLIRLCIVGTRQVQQTFALLTLPNGDAGKRWCVELYVPVGVTYDHDSLIQAVGETCASVFADAKFPEYPLHRWTGGTAALAVWNVFDGFAV